jgi:outer membrane lipoprotein-sorting protein
MKTIKFTLLAATAMLSTSVFAVTPQEIVENYFENTGGKAAWASISGVQFEGEAKQGPMTFPVTLVQLKGGKTYTKFAVQGKEFMQGVFDGEVMWSTNFMTMKAEKSDSETTENMKLNSNDFPIDLFNYDKKGYGLELIGNEEIEGTETFKLKLTKEQQTIEGKKVDDITYYYMDAEAFVPLMVEREILSGQGKGAIMQVKFSDYQEVKGLYFPFTISQGIKGGPSSPISFSKIALNPEIDPSIFSMPAAVAEKAAPAKPSSGN